MEVLFILSPKLLITCRDISLLFIPIRFSTISLLLFWLILLNFFVLNPTDCDPVSKSIMLSFDLLSNMRLSQK